MATNDQVLHGVFVEQHEKIFLISKHPQPALLERNAGGAFAPDNRLVGWERVDINATRTINIASNLGNGINSFGDGTAPPIPVGLGPLLLEVCDPSNGFVHIVLQAFDSLNQFSGFPTSTRFRLHPPRTKLER